MITLYLSGASREAERVRKVASQLDQSGIFLISDRWFDGAEEWTGRDRLHTRDTQIGISAMHEHAIREASIFWLLWPRTPSYGALYELGYAFAHRHHTGANRMPIVVSGRGCSDTVYTAAADHRDESEELGHVAVLRIANRIVHGLSTGGH